jgi:hypothetical protein
MGKTRADYEHELEELQCRMDARIRSAAAALMNNTKWREVLRVLRGRGAFRWKFVGNERVFLQAAPYADWGLLEKGLGDVLPYCFGPYREIDWIELSFEQAEVVEPLLKSLGQIPIYKTEAGVRITGYLWPPGANIGQPQGSATPHQPGG